MRILAWIVVVTLGSLFVIEPFLIGSTRPKRSELYTVKDWVMTWGSIALFLPLCGRVLGWW